MNVFLIPVNQSKQLWHHSIPEYIWHHLPKTTKTCQTGYTNHDIIHLKIAHDLIFMRYHRKLMRFLRILFMRSRQKPMTSFPAHFIREVKTKGYDVIGVNLFLPKLMKFLSKKGIISSLLYYWFLFLTWNVFEFSVVHTIDKSEEF